MSQNAIATSIDQRRNKKLINKELLSLVSGDFSPKEATDLLSLLVEGQMNFRKRQFLTQFESDHTIGMQSYDKTLAAIKENKNKMEEVISRAIDMGYNISLEAKIEMKLVK